ASVDVGVALHHGRPVVLADRHFPARVPAGELGADALNQELEVGDVQGAGPGSGPFSAKPLDLGAGVRVIGEAASCRANAVQVTYKGEAQGLAVVDRAPPDAKIGQRLG